MHMRLPLFYLALQVAANAAAGREVEVQGTRCPGVDNQCSLHGACAINRQGTHVCNCEWGYTTDDCSVRTSTSPSQS